MSLANLMQASCSVLMSCSFCAVVVCQCNKWPEKPPTSFVRGVYSDTTQLDVELSCVAIDTSPTQLNSTRRRVELCRYRRVFIAIQLNWTQLTQLNSVQPSQSWFCLWRHGLQTESTGSLRLFIGDSWVELSWVVSRHYKHPFTRSLEQLRWALLAHSVLFVVEEGH